MNKRYLVFDIETTALPYEYFDESRQEYILRGAKTPEEEEKKLNEMALSPMTSRVVCIGLQLMKFNDEQNEWQIEKKAAFSLDPNYIHEYDSQNFEDKKIEFIEETLSTGDKCYLSSERDILRMFWQIIQKYDYPCLISFNGRNFDAPFLMLRSAVLKVRPTKNLMEGTRFNYSNHIDLIDELCFYNGSTSGATKRYNFDFYARTFGIHSPKSEGVDGSKVGAFLEEGRISEISEYCLRDVSATWELFLIWNEYLNFKR